MPDSRQQKLRWYRLTPDRFLIALLPIEGLLFLSERFRWFPFNEHKGWTVLIAVAVVCLAVVLLLLWLGVSLVFRRRFQFSIRSLLLFVVVVAVVCSWLAVKMQQARRQREAVEAVEKGDGWADYDYEIDADGNSLPGTPEPSGPSWLRNLLGVDFLSDVRQLDYDRATDAELMHLKGLTSLEILRFFGAQFTDTGLMHLEGLTSLETLRFDTTQVTDAGLVHLKGLMSLQHLSLEGTQVTDAGMVHLKELTSLESLDLSYTQVTDAGLVHLKGLTSLTWLRLRWTPVTDAGVQDLQEALPNCEISDY